MASGIALAVALAAALLAVSGAGTAAPEQTPRRGGTIVVGLPSPEPACLNLLDERCGCGNNFPLMSLQVARVSDNFVLPDGRVVHGEFFTHLMYGSEGIRTFQFHQTAPDRIQLWVVPDGSATSAARSRVLEHAVRQIKALTAAPLNVEVHETDAIPLSHAGKHRFTRSDVAG